jgi:hypothetical protein
MNLTLSQYIQKYLQCQNLNNNLTSSVYSFSGNGTLNDIKVSATGNGLMVPKEDGNSSITDGRGLF